MNEPATSLGRSLPGRVVAAAAGLAAMLVGAGALAGCRLLADDRGLFVDPRDDYLQAKPGKPLAVPGGLEGASIVDAWPIPDIVEQPVVKVYPTEAPRPAVLVGRDFDAVRIQRLGTARWIVLGDPPAKVWPTLKQFLAESGVALGREDPRQGVVDSAWLVVADADHGDVLRTAIRDGRARHAEATGGRVPAGRERIRFRVEQGIRRGSTEVHVVHQRALGAGDDQAPAIVEVEAEVTAKLAEYFAAGVGDAVSMVGREVATARKAEVVKDAAGYPALRLNVGFDRAWATVGQALERAEIAMRADRDSASYRAEFPTAGTGGWLKRIVPGGEGRDAPVRISVERQGDGCLIRVATPQGEPLALSLAEEVLVTLREFAA